MLSSYLSVLTVTLVYCDQTVGWIKMKLGMELGLGPGHIVLDGDPAPPNGAQPPILGPCPLWPNGWMGIDTTLYGGRPQPRRLCARLGPRPSNFRPMSIVAKRLDGSRCSLVQSRVLHGSGSIKVPWHCRGGFPQDRDHF